jgi:hypothetical protein
MGCDIHLFTEKKKGDKWINIDNWKLNPYYDKNKDDGEREYYINEAYGDRCYSLFAMLADVRNESDNIFISVPKGLPTDMSELVKKESENWDGDGHSYSYFTMKELYDFYESNGTVKYSGLVDEDGIKEIEKGNMPKWWCQGSSQPLIYKEWTYKNEVFEEFIKKLEQHFESEYYNKENDSENYRIVFWFDN